MNGIFFEEELYKHKVYIDEYTKNLSFLKMHQLLKMKNVKNNLFMLTTFDKDLIGIDPFDPNLDTQMIAKIARESYNNVWYFFREIVRISDSGSGNKIHFRGDRATLALIFMSFVGCINSTFICVPRQIMKTITSLSILLYLMYVKGSNVQVAMLAKDNGLSQTNVARLKDMRDNLPKYMVKKSPHDVDNRESIVVHHAGNNKLLTYCARIDKPSSMNICRGESPSVVMIDEIAYFNNIDVAFPVVMASAATAAENARNVGLPAFNIFATTAALLNSESGKFAYSLVENAARFHEKMYDCRNREELVDLVSKNSTSRTIYIHFNHLQLGKTDEWLKDRIANSGGCTQETIETDFLCRWLQKTDNAVIPEHLLRKIKASELEPVEVELLDGYVVNWYVNKSLLSSTDFYQRNFIIGMDCAENIGRDFTSILMLDPTDMSIIMTCRCNEINLIKMGMHIVELMLKFENAVFIPERNSTGVTILDVVFAEFERRSINSFTRIYNTVVQNKHLKEFKDFNVMTEPLTGKTRSYFGFRTHGGQYTNTRNLLYKQILLKACEMNHSKIYDSILIQEMCQLSMRNGRVDHNLSGHDDLCISYLLSCYLVYEGQNLDIYGIDRSKLLSRMNIEGKTIEEQERDNQTKIRATMRDIEDKMKFCTSPFIKLSYERRLKELAELIDDKNIPVSTASKEQMKSQIENIDPRKHDFDMYAFERIKNYV